MKKLIGVVLCMFMFCSVCIGQEAESTVSEAVIAEEISTEEIAKLVEEAQAVTEYELPVELIAVKDTLSSKYMALQTKRVGLKAQIDLVKTQQAVVEQQFETEKAIYLTSKNVPRGEWKSWIFQGNKFVKKK